MILTSNKYFIPYEIKNLKDIKDINLVCKILIQIVNISYNTYKNEYYNNPEYSLYISKPEELINEFINYYLSDSDFFLVLYNTITYEVFGYCYSSNSEICIPGYDNWLIEITLNKQYQRNGYGKMLLNTFNKEMKKLGKSNYYLYCTKKLIKLYNYLGYKFLFSYKIGNMPVYIFSYSI